MEEALSLRVDQIITQQIPNPLIPEEATSQEEILKVVKDGFLKLPIGTEAQSSEVSISFRDDDSSNLEKSFLTSMNFTIDEEVNLNKSLDFGDQDRDQSLLIVNPYSYQRNQLLEVVDSYSNGIYSPIYINEHDFEELRTLNKSTFSFESESDFVINVLI